MTDSDFLEVIEHDGMTMLERSIALIWRAGEKDPSARITVNAIATALESAGFATQNRTRLNAQLAADRRTAKAANKSWKLVPKARRELDERLRPVLGSPKRSSGSDSVLPVALFSGTRGYLEKVCTQINQSYDYGMYDCCSVMCRRIVETLLIEIYEKAGRESEIKGNDGHYLMLAGLLQVFESDEALHPGRGTIVALRDFKRLGDLSAHNRRFNAHKSDIDRVRDGLRVAADDLLHLAGLR